ncbi:Intradiol ring-cleavage dioxygenase [Xylariaceae sp. FL0804]|nr:Intradiol ring-cleavage dioxygenase [Xylariaceae sp. FL0804]
MRFTTLTAAMAAAGLASAHGDHDVGAELRQRRDFLSTQKRAGLGHCADRLKARNVERRTATLQAARAKRGLARRTMDSVLATDHNKTAEGFSESTAAAALFADYNSCLLTPIVTQGPYFVADEFVRANLKDDQEGVPLTLDFQIVDINTCEPMADTYLDIWHANATGVYSGVAVDGNGSGEDDTANLDLTYGRGVQKTDADGVAQFDTIFPGHYTGRTTHIHTVVHKNATLQANGTLGAITVTDHIGQVFFDQDLISLVEAEYPYTTNTQDLTTNAEDSVLESETATDGVDPLMEYVMLGDAVEDGIFAWVAFGINSTYTKVVDPVVYLTEDGGVDNSLWDDNDGRPL